MARNGQADSFAASNQNFMYAYNHAKPGSKLTAGILGLFLLVACQKQNAVPENNQNSGQNSGTVTAVGTPIGAKESAAIGAAGGTVSTADHRLTIEFPAGALETETTVTIQPVTNECPGAAGTAYRITPHLNLLQPATLTFHYHDTDFSGSAAPLLAVAFQNDRNVWETVRITANDTANKEISITTSHFSDWSLFRSLELVPESALLNPGETRLFQVRRYVPVSDEDELPVPEVGTFLTAAEATQQIRDWKLIGAGVLSPEGARANYTAPDAAPGVNPVINVRLKNTGKMELTLVANIRIRWEGAKWRVDGGAWKKGHSNTGVLLADGLSVLDIEADGNPAEYMTISWQHDKPLPATYSWSLTGNPLFFYDMNGFYFEHVYPLTPGVAAASPGGITITEFNTPGGYVAGTFLLEKAAKINPCPSCPPTIHRIEGSFRVKYTGAAERAK